MKIKLAAIANYKKAGLPIVCLTAYTYPVAKILARHADILLVGDSVGNALYGYDTTLPVTLETMIRHGEAVMRAAAATPVVVDMPFGTYEESQELALRSARRIIDETGCDAVKLEGGAAMEATIAHIVKNDIPVMAHIGLLPQSVVREGGYKIKGKTDDEAVRLVEDAKAIERAGAFAVVIEGTIENVARQITQSINIPTIGIGASAACDGQVLVVDDMLGLTEHTAKFVKKYADLAGEIDRAAEVYAAEVRARAFPTAEHVYTVRKRDEA